MRNRARVPMIAATVAWGFAFAPLLNLSVASAQTSAVSIQNFAFAPTPLNVPVGTTVTWTNSDEAAHTATSDSGAFGSAILNTGQSYSFTFSTAGTFTYHCTIHRYMTGTIVVSAAGPAPTDTTVPVPSPTGTSSQPPSTTDTPAPTVVPTATSTTVAPTATPTTASAIAVRILVSPSSLAHGKASTVKVTVRREDNKAVVPGATITVNGKAAGIKGTKRGKTNAHGLALFKNIRAPHKGSLTITASKTGFKSASAHVKVR